MMAAALIGALYGALPGILLAYYDANEVITTIMLNFIATAVAFTIVRSFLRRALPSRRHSYRIMRPSGDHLPVGLVFLHTHPRTDVTDRRRGTLSIEQLTARIQHSRERRTAHGGGVQRR